MFVLSVYETQKLFSGLADNSIFMADVSLGFDLLYTCAGSDLILSKHHSLNHFHFIYVQVGSVVWDLSKRPDKIHRSTPTHGSEFAAVTCIQRAGDKLHLQYIYSVSLNLNFGF